MSVSLRERSHTNAVVPWREEERVVPTVSVSEEVTDCILYVPDYLRSLLIQFAVARFAF